MKQLIVNADDLGASVSRNTGIFEAIEAGSVTSVSLLPNGPALKHAIAGIQSFENRNISLGIHLNLSEGRPISSGLKAIVGNDGCFPGKASAHRLFTQCEDSALEKEICMELSAQILLFRDAGVRIDHLDGHQHIHIFPAVARLAAEMARTHGIPWVRLPDESVHEVGPSFFAAEFDDEARMFSRHAEAARPMFRAMGIRMPDHFRGLYLKGRLPAALWEEFFTSIPTGLTEFMVHPGRADADSTGSPFAGFSTADRERELEALTDGRFQSALREKGVRLTPFPVNQN